METVSEPKEKLGMVKINLWFGEFKTAKDSVRKVFEAAD